MNPKRLTIELKTKDERTIAESFKLQCLTRKKNMREVLLSMMHGYNKQESNTR